MSEVKCLIEVPLLKETVEALDKLFPEKCPRPLDKEREIWMYAGKRDLVRSLIRCYEMQQERAYKETKSVLTLKEVQNK